MLFQASKAALLVHWQVKASQHACALLLVTAYSCTLWMRICVLGIREGSCLQAKDTIVQSKQGAYKDPFSTF